MTTRKLYTVQDVKEALSKSTGIPVSEIKFSGDCQFASHMDDTDFIFEVDEKC